jgi:uncharacterized protein YqjF (DUF2071 family)
MQASVAARERILWPIMLQEWSDLTFLHWRYPAGLVQALLPSGVAVERFDGDAWVGLVPFFMRIRFPGLPALPYLTVFPETNVRTYVIGPDGRSAVWFLSLDVPRLAAVVAARAVYRLPYIWSRMSLCREGAAVRYQARRHLSGASSLVAVEVGELLRAEELDELDHFVTARWRLVAAARRGRLVAAGIEHRPWTLAKARVVELDDDLIRAAGLPAPQEDPVVHHASSVRVRIGRPRRLRGSPSVGEGDREGELG